MTNEEKALEIARSCFSKRTVDKPINQIRLKLIEQACLKMAIWKDIQYHENHLAAVKAKWEYDKQVAAYYDSKQGSDNFTGD